MFYFFPPFHNDFEKFELKFPQRYGSPRKKHMASGLGRSKPEVPLGSSQKRAPETGYRAPECGLNGKEKIIVQFKMQRNPQLKIPIV